jgi:hypothetical protein
MGFEEVENTLFNYFLITTWILLLGRLGENFRSVIEAFERTLILKHIIKNILFWIFVQLHNENIAATP